MAPLPVHPHHLAVAQAARRAWHVQHRRDAELPAEDRGVRGEAAPGPPPPPRTSGPPRWGSGTTGTSPRRPAARPLGPAGNCPLHKVGVLHEETDSQRGGFGRGGGPPPPGGAA